ncbi:MAG: AMP-binding protein [Actinobacteria bacterium]|nr:AMP-binding protein [Actinomycetota bacterium]
MSVFTLAQLVAKTDAAERQRVAVADAATALTYEELEHRAERVAAGLAAAGFAKGDRLCVLMHTRTEWHEVFFALARLGGVIVPLNHLLTPHEIAYIADDCGARWLVAEPDLWDKVDGLDAAVRERLTVIGSEAGYGDHDLPGLRAGDAPAPAVEVNGDDLFLLQYTSGTTGFPKGAMHTHATVMWNAISQRPHFDLSADTVYYCLPALSWVAGFHSLHLETLWSGGRVVLAPSNRSFDPREFCATVERERVTTVALVPTVLRLILSVPDLESFDLSSWMLAIAGGEAVPVNLLEEMAARLPDLTGIQVYGMSEFPSLVTLLEPADAARKLGSAGRPNCVSQMRVVDADDVDRAPGEVGEILTRSPATMIGYYGRGEETAAALRGGWLHTGDLGYLDEDGFLFISGRSKDVIISGGLNIYPVEIEGALMRHPAVAEAAVIPVPDEKWGEIAKAVIVLEDGRSVDADELRTSIEPFVARFKIPKQWQITHGPPLPKTASGKLQKFKLVEAERAR